ncbi:metallophosphoesterase [Paracoccus aerodenitrificans]|uniref:metallophosphoesterase n=1 Tax=Paracoccus aerodenitrificans TaxID=3017781 RepID=UPI0022F07FFA|nr:metallophosphoesterase [Paracoccus aerodenitrificans]WBU64900.1 metallophosphoesterase [Paracoccus aerodenitrificans]
MTRAYDIIPDIHADIDRLTSTLECLGYVQGSASWLHPEGRIAAFLGDFIDMGRTNRSVLTLVRAMRDQGHAVAIMGNHELNALLYHRPGLNADGTDDGYMRAHSAKNRDQHQTFLDEFPVGHPDTNEMLDWFLSLPLFLDLGGMRLVHACWDDARMATIRNRRPNGLLATEDLQEIALENDATGFAEAVLTTLKGPEAELPAPHYFHDIKGHRRTALRLKWWQSGAMTWRDAALSVPDPETLPATPIEGDVAFRAYEAEAKPVFFGHYKRLGTPTIDAPNAVCLDYPRVTCAYRWAGEATLDPQNLVVLD